MATPSCQANWQCCLAESRLASYVLFWKDGTINLVGQLPFSVTAFKQVYYF